MNKVKHLAATEKYISVSKARGDQKQNEYENDYT